MWDPASLPFPPRSPCHEAFLKTAKQINLSIFSIDKLNLRLIRAFEYIQRFFLIISHKSKKFHVVFDSLSRFLILKKFSLKNIENKFEVLFTAFMIEINTNFKTKTIEKYQKHSVYVKIFNMLKNNDIKLLFLVDNNILYRRKMNNDCASFVLQRMCIFQFMIKDILIIIHDEFNEHTKFDRIYDKLINS